MSVHRNIIESDLSLTECPDIITNQPLPDRWVLVKQFNMETREPCEIWRSGVHNQIKKMQYQLNMVCRELHTLDKEIHEKMQPVTSDEDVSDERAEETKNDTEESDDN